MGPIVLAETGFPGPPRGREPSVASKQHQKPRRHQRQVTGLDGLNGDGRLHLDLLIKVARVSNRYGNERIHEQIAPSPSPSPQLLLHTLVEAIYTEFLALVLGHLTTLAKYSMA